ncbi:MAG: hypothetical protein WCO26_16680, partial [Deltaproteobacteria bacterium]
MSKIKVLDLARDVGMGDDGLLLKLKRMGVKVKDKKAEEPEKTASTSDEKIIERDADKEVVEKRVKPTVIRRRTRSLETKAEAQPEQAPSAVEPAPPLPPPHGADAVSVLPEEKPLKVVEGEPKSKENVPQKAALSAEGRGEVKEALPAKPVEAKTPLPGTPKDVKPREEAKREGPEPKPKVAVSAKEELKLPKKLVEEEAPPPAKKKVFAKKRRVIEERMLIEEPDEEGPPEKGKAEGLPSLPKPFRPMKKTVVMKAT